MKKFMFFLGCIIVLGLAFKIPKVLPPTAEQLAEIITANPEADTAAISQGFAVFNEKCQKCHKLKDATTLTSEKLDKVLPKMFKKAKLTEEQSTLVQTYMMAFRKKS